jgi:hypothetical protein
MFSFDKPSHHDGNPLDGPEGAQAADGVGRQRFGPPWPTDLENPEGTFEQQNDRNKKELANLNTHIEKQQRHGDL